MSNSEGPQPRFGTDYLFDWLSRPVKSPDADLERRLALVLLEKGEHLGHTQAFRYSRDDWQLRYRGATATLTFQNFAQMDGSNPRTFVAYTVAASNKGHEVLRGVHEKAFVSESSVQIVPPEDKIQVYDQRAMAHLERLLDKPARRVKALAASAVPA